MIYMAKYFRADLSKVKATNRGGRLHSAICNEKDLVNGTLGYLGGFVAGSTEIREFVTPTAELVKGKLPVIVMKPEIVYDETKRLLGDFINIKGKAFPVVPLEEFDNIDLSADFLDLTGKANGEGGVAPTVAVGDIFVLQANNVAGTQLKYSAQAPGADVAGFYFKVIDIRNSHIANVLYDDGSANAVLFPQAYKIVALELVVL